MAEFNNSTYHLVEGNELVCTSAAHGSYIALPRSPMFVQDIADGQDLCWRLLQHLLTLEQQHWIVVDF